MRRSIRPDPEYISPLYMINMRLKLDKELHTKLSIDPRA